MRAFFFQKLQNTYAKYRTLQRLWNDKPQIVERGYMGKENVEET